MKFSIITPTLDREGFLRECIQSVLEQDYEDLEHIIVDGGSTDGTVALLKSLSTQFGDRIRWISKPDNGISHAVNRGLAMATGDVINWIGSDDKLAKEAVRTVARFLEENKDVQWVYGSYIEINGDGSFRRVKRAQPFDYRRFVRCGYICGPAVFIRSDLARRVGPLREDMLYCMDYEWCLRMAAITAPRPVDAVLASFRWHPGCITMARRLAQIDEGQRFSLPYARGAWEHLQIVAFCKLAKAWAWSKRLRWRVRNRVSQWV